MLASTLCGLRGSSRVALVFFAFLSANMHASDAEMENMAKFKSAGEIVEDSVDADWRTPEANNLLVMQIVTGNLLIELAPPFAPSHRENLRILTENHYFDGLTIYRVQDNYVVQWGGGDAPDKSGHTLGEAKPSLPAEFFLDSTLVSFDSIDADDAYAESTGFMRGFPVASDGKRTWLTHCYGMLGAGRANALDSGNAAELYVVIGHAPRHLDRNVTLMGRVLSGIELLSVLPRGPAPMGFYKDDELGTVIKSVRFADQIEDYFVPLQVFRTDNETFRDYVDALRNRHEDWFADPTGKIELCNVRVPVRQRHRVED